MVNNLTLEYLEDFLFVSITTSKYCVSKKNVVRLYENSVGNFSLVQRVKDLTTRRINDEKGTLKLLLFYLTYSSTEIS